MQRYSGNTLKAVVWQAVLLLIFGCGLVAGACRPAAAGEGTAPLPLAEAQQRAAAGDSQAQFELGHRYATGAGVAKDDAQAVHWYRLAAEQHHALAQNNLGACYELGRGVPVDQAKAVHWYRLAAEQDQPVAQNSLAIKLYRGEGVKRDPVMAYYWMKRAAAHHYKVAARNSELIYRTLTEEQKAKAEMLLDQVWQTERQQRLKQLMEKPPKATDQQ